MICYISYAIYDLRYMICNIWYAIYVIIYSKIDTSLWWPRTYQLTLYNKGSFCSFYLQTSFFFEMHVSHKINGLVVTHFPFRKYAFVARKSRKEGGRGDIEGEESAQSNKVSLVTGGEKSGCFWRWRKCKNRVAPASRGQPIYGHLQQMSQIGRTDQAERSRKMRWFVLARKSVDIFCQQYIFDLYFPAIQPLQIQIHVVYIWKRGSNFWVWFFVKICKMSFQKQLLPDWMILLLKVVSPSQMIKIKWSKIDGPD